MRDLIIKAIGEVLPSLETTSSCSEGFKEGFLVLSTNYDEETNVTTLVDLFTEVLSYYFNDEYYEGFSLTNDVIKSQLRLDIQKCQLSYQS